MSVRRPYVVGLTGNIATGKSTVGKMLERFGALLIDADKLAHRLMRPGTDVNERVRRRFEHVAGADGEIDRARLGALVFTDAQALADLEAIVHPAVIDETDRRLAACEHTVCVVEAIKLIEADMYRQCDAVWVVTATKEQQLRRLMNTRGLSESQARQRIEAQPPAAEKLAFADVIIDNSSDLSHTLAQVKEQWRRITDQVAKCDPQ